MTDFITVTEVGDYVGRDLSADDGATLAVSMACATVRTLTEQDFAPVHGGTAVLDGTGTDTLLLPQVPVNAAGTVVVNGSTLATNEYVATSDGRLMRTAGTATGWDSWAQYGRACGYWPPGHQNVTVTYDYGFSGTAPDDIRMVALMIATRLVTQGGATSETVGQVTRRYAVAGTDLTNGEKAIIRKYKVAR